MITQRKKQRKVHQEYSRRLDQGKKVCDCDWWAIEKKSFFENEYDEGMVTFPTDYEEASFTVALENNACLFNFGVLYRISVLKYIGLSFIQRFNY